MTVLTTEITPLLRPGIELHGRRGVYTIRAWINGPSRIPGQTTPGYTPTTLAPRLAKPRPQVYEAVDRNGNAVAVKAIEALHHRQLRNEAQALQRISFFGFIGPHLLEMPKVHDQQIIYIVYEWLDASEWRTLRDEIEGLHQVPICNRNNPPLELERLRRSLALRLEILHVLGIIHGDLKPEHVLLHYTEDSQSNKHVDFTQIRLIDFGLSYLKRNKEIWRGGSIGFSSPYFWEHPENKVLTRQELLSIDNFSTQALLYYAYTGEFFPVASPTYRYLGNTNDRSIQVFYENLEKTLRQKHFSDHEPEFFGQMVHLLCAAGKVESRNYLQEITSFVQLLIVRGADWFVWLLLLLSAIFQSGFSLFSKIGIGLFVSIINAYPLLQNGSKGKKHVRLLLISLVNLLAASSITFYASGDPIRGLLKIIIPLAFLIVLGSVAVKANQVHRTAILLNVLGPLLLPLEILFVIPAITGFLFDIRKKLWLPIVVGIYSWIYSILIRKCLTGVCAGVPGLEIFSTLVVFLVAWLAIGLISSIILHEKSRSLRGLFCFGMCMIAAVYPLIIAFFMSAGMEFFESGQKTIYPALGVVLFFFLIIYPGYDKAPERADNER